MIITTGRLELRPWSESETEAFFTLARDEGFNRFSITNYQQADLDSAQAWIRNAAAQFKKKSMGKWGVWERENQSLIGMGGLTPWDLDGEALVDIITYRLRESAWRRGYGSELTLALFQYGFHVLKLPEITATITPDNGASKTIAARFGMRLDRRIVLLGKPTDLFRLRRGDFCALEGERQGANMP